MNCVDLTPFVINPDAFNALIRGGNISSNVPVYFSIPSDNLYATVKEEPYSYCLVKSIGIPDFVGPNKCGMEYDHGEDNVGSSQCSLAIGLLAMSDSSIQKEHKCLCSTTSVEMTTFYNSSFSLDTSTRGNMVNDALFDMHFHDMASIMSALEDDSTASASPLSVYISTCQNNHQEGVDTSYPSFVLAMQWISNDKEQCTENLFDSNLFSNVPSLKGDDYDSIHDDEIEAIEDCGYSLSSIVGMTLGAIVLAATLLGLGCVLLGRKNKTSQKSVPTGKQPTSIIYHPSMIQSASTSNDCEHQQL